MNRNQLGWITWGIYYLGMLVGFVAAWLGLWWAFGIGYAGGLVAVVIRDHAYKRIVADRARDYQRGREAAAHDYRWLGKR